jgi:plastocyanin
MSASAPIAIKATIQNFILPALNISVGTTVNWTQADIVSHTTTSGVDGGVRRPWME